MKTIIKWTAIGLCGLVSGLGIIHCIKIRKIHKSVTEELGS